MTTRTEHRPRDGITPHHRTHSTRWRHIDHIPVTSPEQTILDCAATIKSDKLLRRIIRQAQAEQATTHARLLLVNAQSAGARGTARLRTELADGPSPDTQRQRGRSPHLPDHNAVIEVDSPLHDNPAARKHDAAKQDRLEAKGLKVYRLS